MPVGWADTYIQSVAGQSFDITGVPDGTYYIEVIANPQKVLHETTTSNDISFRKVILGRHTRPPHRKEFPPGTESTPNPDQHNPGRQPAQPRPENPHQSAHRSAGSGSPGGRGRPGPAAATVHGEVPAGLQPDDHTADRAVADVGLAGDGGRRWPEP